MCTLCKAFLDTNYFFEHRKRCTKLHEFRSSSGMQGHFGLAPDLLEKFDEGDDKGFIDLLNRFNNDRKGIICRQNKMIVRFGSYLYKKNRRRKGKQVESRKMVMQNMRMLASLYLEFEKMGRTNGLKNLKIDDMFNRSNWNVLERAIENLSMTDEKKLKHGSKLFIGNVIKRAIKIFKGICLIEKNDAGADELDKFSSVLNLQWNGLFADAEYQVLRNREDSLRRPEQLPIETDVSKVRNYTVAEISKILDTPKEKINSSLFVKLRNLAITRITFFNARRGGEPSRILLSEWSSARCNKWINSSRMGRFSDQEKENLVSNKLIYQGGKGTGQMVPVIILKDLIPVLDILSDQSLRIKCGVNSQNSFLFPTTHGSLDHAVGYNCIQLITLAAGVSNNLTATKMRHRASTLFADMEMPQEQREFFYAHMGHSAEINKHVYQCPASTQEIEKVGSYLNSIDENAATISDIPGTKNNFLTRLGLRNIIKIER